ncbi:hypothetical protein BDU57DRAFT_533509 [Ampelomyces quisqualis]|uniref:Uncharacterized protein n=1 Tax=Ampelomyces quisqualis TaxID=50730 RepID=A0A6A5QAU4_AMPQU|nr:hypothetical protein BDU57DRAFT_533509 [Ampelomyces quisqualis]
MFPTTRANTNLIALPTGHSIYTDPCIVTAYVSLSTRTLLDSTHAIYSDPAIQHAYASKPAKRSKPNLTLPNLHIALDAYDHIRRGLPAPVAGRVWNACAPSSHTAAFDAGAYHASQHALAVRLAVRVSACGSSPGLEYDVPERASYFEDWDGLDSELDGPPGLSPSGSWSEEEGEEVESPTVWRCADVKEARSCWADENYEDEEEVERFIVGWTPGDEEDSEVEEMGSPLNSPFSQPFPGCKKVGAKAGEGRFAMPASRILDCFI